MKTPDSFNGLQARLSSLKRAATCLLLATSLTGAASAATTINGLNVTSTSAAGAVNFDSFWNTTGGDIVVNCFVIGSANLNGPFLNGPSDAQAGFNFALSPGTHTFSLFAPGGGFNANHSFNLFFNGNAGSPGISVYAPTALSAVPPFPAFSPNGNITRDLNHVAVAGANSLGFSDGVNVVTLTGWHWLAPAVLGLDRTATGPGNFGSSNPDGFTDWVGQFTLDVSPVPEPGTGVLLLLGGTLFLSRLRRRKIAA